MSVIHRTFALVAARLYTAREEEGQALVEYALLLALIAIVSIGILTLLGQNVSSIFSKINNRL